MRCAVFGCCVNNDKIKSKIGNEEISYHSFPKQSQKCKQWVLFCRRKDKFNIKTTRICSKHFEKSDFVPINPLYEQYGIVLKTKRLKDDAVPSLLLPLQKAKQVISQRDLRMRKRLLTSSDAVIDEHDEELIELEISADCPQQIDASKADCGTQVEPLMIDCGAQPDENVPTYSQLLEEIAELKAKNFMQQHIINTLSQRQLKKSKSAHNRASAKKICPLDPFS